MTRETYGWQIERGPRVSLETVRDGARIVISDRGVRLVVWPSHAAQIASAIDECLRRVDRQGQVARE